MKRPWDILFATLLAVLVLVGTLWGLREYVRANHRPAQNWLPQGSFRPDIEGQPEGWQATPGLANLRFERSTGHLPLSYLHLEPGPEAAWTDMPLGRGWRLVHLSAWFRVAHPGSEPAGRLTGLFMKADQVLQTEDMVFSEAFDNEWHEREVVWARPPEATVLRLVFSSSHPDGMDVAELIAVPSYLYSERRKVPTR